MSKKNTLFRRSMKTIFMTLGMLALGLSSISASDYTGATVTITGLGQYTGEGEYTYKEMSNDKPSFSFQNKMIEWNGDQWEIYANRNVYAINIADTDSLPANGWVVLDAASGDIITITGTCVEDNIVDDTPSYAGATVTITGLGQYTGEGEYTYKEMLNGKPSFGFQDKKMAWNGSQWQIFAGANVYASNTSNTDSLPANGWSISVLADGESISLVGDCVVDNEVSYVDPLDGVELSIAGLFNGNLEYYETLAGKPVFGNEDLNGEDVYLHYSEGYWIIEIDEVDSLKCLSFENEIPENKWKTFNSNEIVDFTIAHLDDVTTDLFSRYSVNCEIAYSLVDVEFLYTGVENGYPVYTATDGTSTLYLGCTGTSWEIRADAKDGILYHESRLMDEYKAPQNGWSAHEEVTPSLFGTYTTYFYVGSKITISGSENGEFDGELTCTFRDYGTLVFEATINGKEVVLTRNSSMQTITVDGQEVAKATSSLLESEMGIKLIPQNGWYTTDGEYYNISINGELTSDMYVNYYLTLDGRDIYYSAVDSGRLDFSNANGDTTITFSEDDNQWQIHINGTLSFVSDKYEKLTPRNGWSAVSGGELPVFESTNTSIYSFLNEVITMSGDATGEFTFTGEYENDAPIFSSTNATGILSGKAAYIIFYEYDWMIRYEGDDEGTFITAFDNEDHLHEDGLIPQNQWSTDNGNITLSGVATYFEFTDLQITVEGTDTCDGTYMYGSYNEKYSCDINNNTYTLCKVTDEDSSTEYWVIYAHPKYYIDEIIFTNKNVSGDFVPQTGWVSAIDSTATLDIIISGEGTFNPLVQGISEHRMEETNLLVYPTLAKQSITVDAENAGVLSIYGINGVQVMQQTVVLGENKIVVSNLSEGMYIVTLKGKKNTYTSRIVKQ